MSGYRVPKWVDEYARHAQHALRLQEWRLSICITETPNEDNPDADATCHSQPRYLFCRIDIHPRMLHVDRAVLKEIVVHELVHLAHSSQDLVQENVVRELVPRKRRSWALDLITDENEKFTVRMARALVPLIGDPPAKEKQPEKV